MRLIGSIRSAIQHEHAIKAIRQFLEEWTNGPVGDWILQHGRVMRSGEGTWSAREKEFIRSLEQSARLGKAECYANAQWALKRSLSLPAQDINFTYCEGYAAVIGQARVFGLPQPFGHAWCLLNKRVWDPSPTLVAPVAAQMYAYFGVEFLTRFLLESLARKIVRPGYSLLDNPWKGYPVLRLDVSQVVGPKKD